MQKPDAPWQRVDTRATIVAVLGSHLEQRQPDLESIADDLMNTLRLEPERIIVT